MAVKKTTPNSASPKGKAKPAVKPSKPAPAQKIPVSKKSKPPGAKKGAPAKVVESSKPAKKAAPAEKAAPAKKAVPTVKSPPDKKASVAAPAKQPAIPVKPESAVKGSKPEAKPVVVAELNHRQVVKVSAPEPTPSKASSTKASSTKPPSSRPRSSLVDFPVPPAPVKPPFVPPKTVVEPVVSGGNGTHSSTFVLKQQQRLLDLRDELVDAMSGMTRDTIRNAPEGSEASGSGQHQGDAGSDAYDRDFALSVLAKEQDALYEIEQALQRIKKGSYGICEMSSRKIPLARLEAIPFARLTVECQAQWEKEYGKRRFRPSNEVGFSGGKYAEDEDSETVSLDEDED
jgi:DnaK suppressor protein